MSSQVADAHCSPSGKWLGVKSPDSRVVAESLESYARDRLAESAFFADLSAGRILAEDVREVFGQYYLWRNRFHQWFGVCVARTGPFGDAPNAARILGEIIAGLAQEITGDHHGQALSFLSALGIDDPARITVLPVTDAYAKSFLHCYSSADRSGDEALAALAGRELAVPSRNEIIIGALAGHYGVTSGLDLFGPHARLEAERFRALWEALAGAARTDGRLLADAARLEIWEHITFWDDVYTAIRGARGRRAAGQMGADK
jgi:hypothetical protein